MSVLPFILASALTWTPTGLPDGKPEAPLLCQGAFLTPEQGKAVLTQASLRFPDHDSWNAYADHLRSRIQAGAGLQPWPRRTPLNPIVREKRVHAGYTVENVAFESIPGYFVCGNLYRPEKTSGPAPVVLSFHGHGGPVVTEDDYAKQGRFTPWMQARCAALARMGAVVLSVEMVAYGESIAQVGQDSHKLPFSVTLQTWNGVRALDFLLSLPGVDKTRVGVSGESGGGTQTMLLTALDPRVTASAPVVMMSSYFFGGCACESGLPIHRGPDHFANNAMIAALAAPRPLLVVSDGKDWTQHNPDIEFPFLRRIYGYYGVPQRVSNVHLPAEGHDYGPSKRQAVYRFLSDALGLDRTRWLTPAGELDESALTTETYRVMRVFDETHPLPPQAVRTIPALQSVIQGLQKKG
ncbi:MAG: acetylxylan esterase [Opitutaceae bacterium]